MGSSDNVEHYVVHNALGYLATAMQVTGLWVKPPDAQHEVVVNQPVA